MNVVEILNRHLSSFNTRFLASKLSTEVNIIAFFLLLLGNVGYAILIAKQ